MSVWYYCCRVCLRSYPHIGHRGGGVEELADDVGGGGDAEDDGAEDLLPPGQQQHGVLSPATLTSRSVSLYQAHGTVTFLPVTLAVGEVVAVVYREEKQISVSGICSFWPIILLYTLGAYAYTTLLWSFTAYDQYQVLTIWILKDGQGSVAVFFMGELVIIQTLVKFIRADQGWCPRRGICITDKMNKVFDLGRKRDQ